MTMTLQEIRDKYPQYNSKSDIELADAIHKKYYSGLPKETVYAKLGITPDGGNKPLELELVKQQEAPERTGFRGLASDMIHALGSALKGGVGFVRDLPKNLEKSGQYIEDHPGMALPNMAGQLAAETADIGKSIFNAPYNLNQYLARKHLLPQALGKAGKFIPHIPEDTGLEHALGLEADPEKGDALVRAIPDIAALATGGTSLVKATRRAFKAPDLKTALKETQAKVNAMEKNLGSTFDTIEQEVANRGIGAIPVDKALIQKAKGFLEQTPETKELIELALKGDYKALRELQADLRVIGEDALSNKLSQERKVGKEAQSTRKQINKSIEDYFNETGHKDLADLLKGTKKGYSDLQKIYYSTRALRNVFKESQRIPKNPATLLTEDSTEMNRFMAAHPELKEALEKSLKYEKKKKMRKELGKGALKVGAGILGYEGLNKAFK